MKVEITEKEKRFAKTMAILEVVLTLLAVLIELAVFIILIVASVRGQGLTLN